MIASPAVRAVPAGDWMELVSMKRALVAVAAISFLSGCQTHVEPVGPVEVKAPVPETTLVHTLFHPVSVLALRFDHQIVSLQFRGYLQSLEVHYCILAVRMLEHNMLQTNGGLYVVAVPFALQLLCNIHESAF